MPTIPYVKQTWTDGSGGGTPVSAARLGVLEDGINNVSYAPAVRAYHNANQAITTATLTALAFNSERFDQAANASDTMHDNATNNSRLTCRYAGVYLIGATVEWEAVAAGTYRETRLRIGGATYIAAGLHAANTNGFAKQTISALYSMAVNDYVECVVQHDRGSNLNVLTSANNSPEFWMVRVG